MRGRQAGRSYYYYHFDGLGSVIALSDKDGDVVEVYNYDVYGAGIDEPVMMVVINRSADITGAGGVNAADLTDFADAWLSIAGLRYSAFDYNQDGYIGFDDLDWLCQKWLSAGGTDFEDFAEFAALWLTEPGMSPDPGYNADADLYADGRIDFADFAVLAEYWLTDGQRSDDYYYYHFDGLGSVIALSDKDGDVVEVYNYDVYGSVDSVSSPGESLRTVANPYYFTARRFDEETGLYYYRARYYSPEIGRFLQVDPIGYDDSMNLYQYCLNNPIILVDPTGYATIRIYNDKGKTTLVDPSMEQFRSTINSQTAGSINQLEIAGHGSRNVMMIGKGSDPSGGAIFWTSEMAQVGMTDNYESFAEVVGPKLASEATIALEGCNTAREGWAGFTTKGGENIAKQLSRELSDVTVTGNIGYSLGNEWYGYLIGEEHHVIGIDRSYRNGKAK